MTTTVTIPLEQFGAHRHSFEQRIQRKDNGIVKVDNRVSVSKATDDLQSRVIVTFDRSMNESLKFARRAAIALALVGVVVLGTTAGLGLDKWVYFVGVSALIGGGLGAVGATHADDSLAREEGRKIAEEAMKNFTPRRKRQ